MSLKLILKLQWQQIICWLFVCDFWQKKAIISVQTNPKNPTSPPKSHSINLYLLFTPVMLELSRSPSGIKLHTRVKQTEPHSAPSDVSTGANLSSLTCSFEEAQRDTAGVGSGGQTWQRYVTAHAGKSAGKLIPRLLATHIPISRGLLGARLSGWSLE